MLELVTEGDAVLLPVKVVPGASRTRYAGVWQTRAKFAVAAPAEKGRANKALVAFLADRLGVARGRGSVGAGHTSPLKTVRIEGINADAVRTALENLSNG